MLRQYVSPLSRTAYRMSARPEGVTSKYAIFFVGLVVLGGVVFSVGIVGQCVLASIFAIRIFSSSSKAFCFSLLKLGSCCISLTRVNLSFRRVTLTPSSFGGGRGKFCIG